MELVLLGLSSLQRERLREREGREKRFWYCRCVWFDVVIVGGVLDWECGWMRRLGDRNYDETERG